MPKEVMKVVPMRKKSMPTKEDTLTCRLDLDANNSETRNFHRVS
jgi:hypothetical protein